MRFANAWVTCSNRYAWNSLNFREKIRMWAYCFIQRRLLQKAQYIITQSETVRQGLLRITKLPENHVTVIPNVLPEEIKRQPAEPKIADGGWVDIACIAAPVSHKNLDIIPSVLQILEERHGVYNVRFHVTIPSEAKLWRKILMDARGLNVDDRIVNHGYCTQEKLAEIYRSCQICFFPTLLETFSATLLEAAYFRLNVVATNFDFNKEILEDTALYYEPMNTDSAADKIALLMNEEMLRNDLLEKMGRRIFRYSDYKQHFFETVAFLKSI